MQAVGRVRVEPDARFAEGSLSVAFGAKRTLISRAYRRWIYEYTHSVGERSTHPGMNEGSAGFDDDGDLIVVAVAEPVEGHSRGLAEFMAFSSISA